jgi:hypothetical protein
MAPSVAAGTGLAFGTCMMRTLVLVLACVLLAALPADAKKKHARPHAAKHKKAAPRALARVKAAPPPTRVAAAEHRMEPTSPSPAVAPTPAPTPPPAAAPSPPVEHGPLGPQDTDDEVPGSRMKKR